MKTWQLAATHTHLYSGARLQAIAASGTRPRWRAGERLLVEFSDGVVAAGVLHGVAPEGVQMRLDAYRTAKGSAIDAKAWLLHWLDDVPTSLALKVKARIA